MRNNEALSAERDKFEQWAHARNLHTQYPEVCYDQAWAAWQAVSQAYEREIEQLKSLLGYDGQKYESWLEVGQALIERKKSIEAYERRVQALEREALVRNAQVEGYQSQWDERERQLAEAREAIRGLMKFAPKEHPLVGWVHDPQVCEICVAEEALR